MTRFYFEENEDDREQYIKTIFPLSFGLSFIIILTSLVTGYFFSSYFLKGIPFWPYIFFSIGSVFFGAFPSLILALTRAKRKASEFVLIQLAQFAITTINIIIFVVMLKEGAAGKIKADFLSKGIVFLALLSLLKKSLKFSFNKRYVSNVLKYSAPLIPHALGWWGMSLADRLIIQYYLPLQDVGIYSFAFNFGMIVLIFGDALNNAWAPFFFEKAGDERYHKKLANIIKISVSIFCFVALSVDIFSPSIIKFISHNPGYLLATPYVPYLVLSFSFMSFYLLFCNQIFFIKKTYYLSMITGLVAILNIAVKLFLVPRYGIWGVAFSTTMIYAIYFLIVFFIANNKFRLPLEALRMFMSIIFVTFFTFVLTAHTNASLSFLTNVSLYLSSIMILTLITFSKNDFLMILSFAKNVWINKDFRNGK